MEHEYSELGVCKRCGAGRTSGPCPGERAASGLDPTAAALAGRGVRLGAVLLDGVVGLLAMTPGMVAMFTLEGDPDIPIAGVLLLGLGVLSLMVYQVYLLTSSGQTIGKRAAGIRIVRHDDGSNPGFVRAVALRGLLPGLIGAIPYLGVIFSLVDILFIFGDERRCIHDLFAGTRVIVT